MIKVLREHPIAEEIRIPIDVDPPIEVLQVIGVAMAGAVEDSSGLNAADVMADVVNALMGTKRPDGIGDDDLELVSGDAATDLATALLGRYVVETVRAAADDRLEHVDDQFEHEIRRLAPPVVKDVLAHRRAATERATRGLDVLERAVLDASHDKELVTSK